MLKILKAILAVMVTVFIIMFCMGVIEALSGNSISIVVGIYAGGIAAVISALITLVWVVPIHLLLAKFNRKQVYWYFLIAILPIGFFMFLFSLTGGYNTVTYLLQAAFCIALSLSAAFVFWYVGVRKPQIKLTTAGLRNQ